MGKYFHHQMELQMKEDFTIQDFLFQKISKVEPLLLLLMLKMTIPNHQKQYKFLIWEKYRIMIHHNTVQKTKCLKNVQ